MPLPRTPIPRAISYQTPALPPASRGPWSLDRSRVALLVHDMQGYFLRAYDPGCPSLRAAVASIASLLETCRAADVPVLFTAQPGAQQDAVRGLLTPIWGPGIGASPADTAIIRDLAPRPDEAVVVKHRYSAFVGTELESWLRERGRDQLLITGVYAHIGVVATATDALMRDIEPFVAGDAVADFGVEDHRRALDQLASIGASVLGTERAVAALRPVERPAAEDPWAGWLAGRIGDLLGDPRLGAQLVSEPELDLFEAGLDSLRCFELIDDLATIGVDVDFSELASAATAGYLLAQIDRAQPAA